MKTLIGKTVLAMSLMLALVPMFANATDARPDVQFNVQNNTNHAVVFHAETYCADFPGTFVVPAHSFFSYWGEPMDHGNCTYDMKRIKLSAEGYDLAFTAGASPTQVPTYNTRWRNDQMSCTTGIGLADAHYDRNDMILSFVVSQ